jgi:hypothetical protein
VLKTKLKFLVSDFVQTLTKDDLIVTFTRVNDPTIVRHSNVVEVGVEDAANNVQYFKVLFGGSESGNYIPSVRSKNYGRFDTRSVTLVTEGKVLDFNPK